MIHLDRLINYSNSFGSSQPLGSLKIKTVASLITETWAITPAILIKKDLTYYGLFYEEFRWCKGISCFYQKQMQRQHSQMFFKIGVLKNFAIFTGKYLCWSLFLTKLQGFRCFPVNIAKIFKSSFFIEHLRCLLLQMFCFTLYFQKDVAEYIVVLHCIVVSFWNLKSLLFALICCITRCYSLPFVVIRCHLLLLVVPLVVTRCTTRCHSLSFVVPLVVTRCHSFSFTLTLCTTRCHLLSLDYHSLSLLVTRCTSQLSFYKRSSAHFCF